MSFRVLYLGPYAQPIIGVQDISSENETSKVLRFYKRRGLTTWVEDGNGKFIPVKGAMRKPATAKP